MGAVRNADPIEQTHALWRAFLECHVRLMELIERDIQEKQSLPLSWFEVLLFLNEVPDGAMRMQDLASRVLLSKSGLTRLVDRLEAAGLIERRSCPADRRGTYATVTVKGRRALRESEPLVMESIKSRFLEHLTPEEGRVLESLSRRILAANGYSPQEPEGC
ncbi:MAG TPA: MarR family transcriptional regulator [Actinomycetota bacterium]|nr:MarR family transcriptional regulator [Actinomycetota bacterium]